MGIEQKQIKEILYVDNNWKEAVPCINVLGDLGHTVYLVGSYHHAIRVMKEDPIQFDILLTSYALGYKRNGITLINKFKRIFNNSRTFLISSEEDERLAEKARSAEVTKILDRSFNINEFIKQFIEK